MEKLVNHLPANLCFLRKQRKLKQDELYEYLGFSRTTWSNYENGISEPSVNGLLIISKFFGIGLDELVTRDLSFGDKTSSGNKKPLPKNKVYHQKDIPISTVKDSAPALAYVMKELKKLREDIDGMKKVTRKK